MGRIAVLAVVGLAAAAAVHSGIGSDGHAAKATKGASASQVPAGAGAAQLDSLIKEAEARGVPVGAIRSQADRALATARAQADRAIAQAIDDGTDPQRIAGLKSDAQHRLDALQSRIDSALSR